MEEPNYHMLTQELLKLTEHAVHDGNVTLATQALTLCGRILNMFAHEEGQYRRYEELKTLLLGKAVGKVVGTWIGRRRPKSS